MACGCGGGIASWSPLSFDIWEPQPISCTVASPSWEPLDLGVPRIALMEQGRILASRSVGFLGTG